MFQRAQRASFRRLGQLARIGLLVLDDFLPAPPSIVSQRFVGGHRQPRSQVRSSLVVSQLPIEAWRMPG